MIYKKKSKNHQINYSYNKKNYQKNLINKYNKHLIMQIKTIYQIKTRNIKDNYTVKKFLFIEDQ